MTMYRYVCHAAASEPRASAFGGSGVRWRQRREVSLTATPVPAKTQPAAAAAAAAQVAQQAQTGHHVRVPRRLTVQR